MPLNGVTHDHETRGVGSERGWAAWGGSPPFSYLLKEDVLQKPSQCQGCPSYGSGEGYVPDLIRPQAKITFLEFAPSIDDVYGRIVEGWNGPREPIYYNSTPQPLCGVSGYMLYQTYFPLAKLQLQDISVQYVIRCRAALTKETYAQTIAFCTQAHSTTTQGPVIAHGEDAWEVTQGPGYPIQNWRGFLGPSQYHGTQVYGVQHTLDLLRDPHAKFIARFDWKRLHHVLQREWPRPIPERIVASPTCRGAFVDALKEALEQPEIMVDTEYIPDEQLLTHVGAAWRVGETVKGFQLEWVRGQSTSVERAIFMEYWHRLCRKVKMGFWNAKADLPILKHNLNDTPDAIEDPMQAHAVLWPDMDHDYEFVASIYGKYNKLKHLSKTDILLYHWGDMIDLVWIWEALKEEFKHDPQAEQKYRQQNLKLIPILLGTEARGIRLAQRRIESALPTYQRSLDCASRLASAYAGYPLNLGSTKQVLAHLAYDGIKTKTIDKDAIAVLRSKYLPFDADYEEKEGFSQTYIQERVAQGAHPLLELRVMYAQNKQTISHYLEPLRGLERCYPQINIHTQAGGRHSTTRPALATLPNDLRDILIPDSGFVWIGWDWDQQEPRIQRAESQSRILGAAFDAGVDIHTTFVCDLYGWQYPTNLTNPHSASEDEGWRQEHGWQGKDDPRRVFAKTTRYEINYGGTGEQAAKKAVRMGLDASITKRASQVLLQGDPELSAWFRKIEREVVSTHIIHSWDGGRRVFYWIDAASKKQVEEMKRQARNFPPQGGGAGLYNLVIVEIAEQVPEASFVFGMHDSQYWSVAQEGWQEVYPRIKAIATQPRQINGMMVPFPGSFKIIYDDGKTEKLK